MSNNENTTSTNPTPLKPTTLKMNIPIQRVQSTGYSYEDSSAIYNKMGGSGLQGSSGNSGVVSQSSSNLPNTTSTDSKLKLNIGAASFVPKLKTNTSTIPSGASPSVTNTTLPGSSTSNFATYVPKNYEPNKVVNQDKNIVSTTYPQTQSSYKPSTYTQGNYSYGNSYYPSTQQPSYSQPSTYQPSYATQNSAPLNTTSTSYVPPATKLNTNSTPFTTKISKSLF